MEKINKSKARILFTCMIDEIPVYVKGSFLKDVYPDDIFAPDALFPLKVESIWVNDTVNLTYCEGDSFIDTIEGIDFDKVLILK